MAELANSGAKSICIVSDNTDVFILLLHHYWEQGMTCRITMQSTSSDKMCTNISATAKEHAAIVPSLLAMHCLSGCDTVGPMYGIRKRKTSKVLRSGYS